MFKIKAPNGRNNICGERIAQIRKSQKLSQRKLASKMQLLGYDVDNYFIRRVENGERLTSESPIFSISDQTSPKQTKTLTGRIYAGQGRRFAVSSARKAPQDSRPYHKAAESGRAERGSHWLLALPAQLDANSVCTVFFGGVRGGLSFF